MENFGLSGQIRRSAVSIPSNIAEGSSRKSEREYFRYIEIALGSSFELETQLIISNDLKMCSVDDFKEIILLVRDEQKLLNGFLNKLNKDQKKFKQQVSGS